MLHRANRERRCCSRIIRLLGLVALGIVPCFAQWSPTRTPPNVTPNVLAVDDSNVYAGHSKGVLVSHDGGETWVPSVKGLPAGRVTSLAIRRVSGGTMVFAGTQTDGIFISIDNAASWNPVDQTPIVETERHAAVIGAKAYYGGPTVFALIVTDRHLLAGMNFGGVYRSTNMGGSWSVANEGFLSTEPMGPPSITAMTVSGDYLFAGTTGDGIFLSTNNGKQWSGASNGLPQNGRSVYIPINALASVPKEKKTEGENVFAATEGAGIFLTTDDGRRWVPVNSGLRNRLVYSLAAWSRPGRSCVFAGTGDGVYVTTSNGARWVAVMTGMPQTKIYSLAISRDTLYAAVSRSGVWKRSIPPMAAEGM